MTVDETATIETDPKTFATRGKALRIPPEALLGSAPWGDYRRRGQPLLARFSRLVAIGAPDSCWLWTGQSPRGYPVFTVASRPVQARRIAWALSRRTALPAGARVWTTCGHRLCVSPRHLTIRKPAPTAAKVKDLLRVERARVAQAALAIGMTPPAIARAIGLAAVTVRELARVRVDAG